MGIALLILSCFALIFAISFLMAAVFTFAAHDQTPLDHDTDRMLSLAAWFGGWLICVIAISRNWHRCRQGRRFFYTGLLSGAVAVVFGFFATRGG